MITISTGDFFLLIFYICFYPTAYDLAPSSCFPGLNPGWLLDFNIDLKMWPTRQYDAMLALDHLNYLRFNDDDAYVHCLPAMIQEGRQEAIHWPGLKHRHERAQ